MILTIIIAALVCIGLVVFLILRKKAKAAAKAKNDFLAGISHDIRTPMNAMSGFITMAIRNIDDKEKMLEYLDKIELSGQQMLTLVSHLLDNARVESGKFGFKELPMKARKSDASAPKNDTSDFKGKRVLLVDDNDLNREIAKYILEDMGLTVEEATDGDIAVEMVMTAVNYNGRDYYDCILMDIQMPHMNGYKATGKIREVYDYESIHIPVIALSANAMEEDIQNSIEAGMDAHISKPIDINELNEVLNRFLK